MKLSSSQAEALYQALLEAFSLSELERRVSFSLGETLSHIAGQGPDKDVFFQLVTWTQRHNCTEVLLQAALEARPNNSNLMTLAKALEPPIDEDKPSARMDQPETTKIVDVTQSKPAPYQKSIVLVSSAESEERDPKSKPQASLKPFEPAYEFLAEPVCKAQKSLKKLNSIFRKGAVLPGDCNMAIDLVSDIVVEVASLRKRLRRTIPDAENSTGVYSRLIILSYILDDALEHLKSKIDNFRGFCLDDSKESNRLKNGIVQKISELSNDLESIVPLLSKSSWSMPG